MSSDAIRGLNKGPVGRDDLRYLVEVLPEVLTALTVLVGLSAEHAHGTLNMGAGLAVMTRPARASPSSGPPCAWVTAPCSPVESERGSAA
jgi:hypothetical protein